MLIDMLLQDTSGEENALERSSNENQSYGVIASDLSLSKDNDLQEPADQILVSSENEQVNEWF